MKRITKKRQFSSNDRIGYEKDGRFNNEIRVGGIGFAVLRSMEPEKLREVFDGLSSVGSKFPTRSRNGHGTDRSTAVIQLEQNEVMDNKMHLGHLALKPLFQDIYNEVFSIRRRMTVSTSGTRLLGNRSATRTLAIGFDDESRAIVNEEREQILDVINNNLDEPPVWKKRETPHISIVKFPHTLPSETVDKMREVIEESMPSQLTLKRAHIYDPRV